MAKVVCSSRFLGVIPDINNGDFVFTEDRGWGIVGWGGDQTRQCVYYLDGGGYDALTSIHIKRMVSGDKVVVSLDINS